jgi:GW (Gly-Tryp) dipeptide domain
MLLKHLSVLTIVIIMLSGCQTGQVNTPANTDLGNFHKLSVNEVQQTTEYTYLHGKDNGNDIWVVVPAITAKAGDTYYFEGGIEMKKFESKELHRTFESILMLEKLNSEPKSGAIVASNQPYTQNAAHESAPSGYDSSNGGGGMASGEGNGEGYTRKQPVLEKKQVTVQPVAGGVTIAQLYAGKKSFEGKTVKIKGQVVKYTPMVMGKNWIHIQDGTENGGKFDLTVTSTSEVKVGDVVTLEGKISIDKDLGYGYFFEVLMEEAVLK